MAYFIGILDGSGDVWGVRIPDAPGVHGGGTTPEEAIADATSALREVGAMLIAESKALPKPRTIEEILSDTDTPDVKAGETAVMIPLLLDSGRSVRAAADKITAGAAGPIGGRDAGAGLLVTADRKTGSPACRKA